MLRGRFCDEIAAWWRRRFKNCAQCSKETIFHTYRLCTNIYFLWTMCFRVGHKLDSESADLENVFTIFIFCMFLNKLIHTKITSLYHERKIFDLRFGKPHFNALVQSVIICIKNCVLFSLHYGTHTAECFLSKRKNTHTRCYWFLRFTTWLPIETLI